MRMHALITVTVSAAVFASVGFARERVGVLNTRQAIADSAEGRTAAENLKKEFGAKLEALEHGSLAKDSPAYRRQDEALRQEIQDAQKRVLNDLGKKMMAVVGDYARRKHYEAVLDVSDPGTPVLWVGKSNDITARIVAEYDKVYGPKH
jgi:Skp family chaperone for outer membrane proteins